MAAAALMISTSGAAIAAQPAAAQSVDPWLAMSAMSSSGSATAASAAIAQSNATYDRRGFRAPPLPALAVILATLALAIYILVDDDDEDLDIPASPA